MRDFRHWTPRYLRDRAAWEAYRWTHRDAPWITPEMIRTLSSRLGATHTGLEWGAGRSTLWFARRTRSLISVEHSEEWHRRISGKLKAEGLTNVDLRLRTDETWYVGAVQDIPPSSLDYCLVDGLARDRCALVSLPLLRPGGILILDNCNWYLPGPSRSPTSIPAGAPPATEQWRFFLREIKTWPSHWTSSGVTDTALWVKPG